MRNANETQESRRWIGLSPSRWLGTVSNALGTTRSTCFVFSLILLMPEPMIEVEGLTKRFGAFTAVDHVSFTVGKGSIFGFLGPNGSGKTTVIRMLCGILQPTEGTARIGGHDVVRDLEPIKEMIGYMSQKFSLYDELTVNENLIFAGKLYGLSGRELDQRREEMIATTHLEPYIDRRAGQLSGGWRQRLAMALFAHAPAECALP